MKKLYIIETNNKHNNILIFTSKAKARRWSKKATRWTSEQIEKNIKEVSRSWQGFFTIFPPLA